MVPAAGSRGPPNEWCLRQVLPLGLRGPNEWCLRQVLGGPGGGYPGGGGVYAHEYGSPLATSPLSDASFLRF